MVGAGLAGSEAAYAAARSGLATLLVTTSLDTVYNLAVPTPLAPPAGTLMEALLPVAARHHWPVFFLGTTAQWVREAARRARCTA